nr:response regulator [Candidatus Sigynarchaeota archaeon]
MTQDIVRYEQETGKVAVWRGVITESFKKWQRGERIYNRDKERIALYVSEDDKQKWQAFIDSDSGNNLNISKLIRNAVTFYIENINNAGTYEKVAQISHDLKSPLTIIKGFAELLLNTCKGRVDKDVEDKIREIFANSVVMEKIIKATIDNIDTSESRYDVLIVDDDPPTLELLTGYFEFKKISCKGLPTGMGVVKELLESRPKVLLLDVILPEVDGFTLCKQIKNDAALSNTKVIFLTAVPETHVRNKMDECKADGYILKPFNLVTLDVVKKYI